MTAPGQTARVTILVLTYNRADEVLHTLEKLVEGHPDVPIIVVDNGSTDATANRISHAFPQITVVRCASNLGAAGRNAGVARVTTDYVAFCDDDTWWEDRSPERAVALLDAHPQVALLSARVIVGEDGVPDATCEAMAHSPLASEGLPGPALIGYMAGAAIFRASAYREVGGYDPRFFIGGEEELLALDLLARGWKLVYAPMLTLRHCPSPVRDAVHRRQLLARNAVWVGCMRLPPAMIVQRIVRALGAMVRSRSLLRDGLDMLKGLPAALWQ